MAAMSAAQKGERFSTAAVMIGCVLLRPCVQLQARDFDQENDHELGPVFCAEHDRNEVAPTVGLQNQERDGK